MDSFIFGTPLSFIEHHIQHGNALMGATVQDFFAYNAVEVAQNDLFVDNLSTRFDELRSVMHELDAMKDTTAAEVERSKVLWKKSIAPKLNLLSRALSFICMRRALLAEGDSKGCELLDKTPNLITQLFDESKSVGMNSDLHIASPRRSGLIPTGLLKKSKPTPQNIVFSITKSHSLKPLRATKKVLTSSSAIRRGTKLNSPMLIFSSNFTATIAA